MTYNMSLNGGGGNGPSLGVPGSGFASRGKGSHIKRLNLQPRPSHLAQVDEARPLPSAGPRTARSHLLAGLRTAPRQPSAPTTAPLFLQDGARRGSQQHQQQSMYPANVPYTAAAANFPNTGGNDYANNNHLYSLPEHVLAPPPLDMNLEVGEHMDERMYTELMSANLYLAAQQHRLQQQLASVTAAAQQYQNMNYNLTQGIQQQQQQQQTMSPGVQSGFYQQQQQVPQSMQSVVQAVPGQPGVYCVYNPLTGQQDFVVDESVRQEELTSPGQNQGQTQGQFQEQYRSTSTNNNSNSNNSYPFRQAFASPGERPSPVHSQSPSPPRSTNSPAHPEQPLPAPLKRNHRKNLSVALKVGTDARGAGATPKTSMFPPTPASGTFGPGQGRAGEHPIRQPRGPPPLEELVAKPTSKFEGSKNFATRQRRRAVHNLVRAGMERRGGSNNTGGSLTPSSDSDFDFSPTESDGTNHSASVSSRPSMGSLRGVNAAIGSERKERAYDSQYSPPGGDDKYGGDGLPPTAADVVAGRNAAALTNQPDQRRRMPMFVLSSAEKRKVSN